MAEDTAQELRIQCENQRSLKDTGIDPALRAVRQHSGLSAHFVKVLAQLARYKMEVARRDHEMHRDVVAAVETRRATLDVGFDALSHDHLSLAQSVLLNYETDSDGLLRCLAVVAKAALARTETARLAVPKLEDLAKLHEDGWRKHVTERDQALQDHVQLAELRLVGLRAKQRCLQRAVSMCEVTSGLPEVRTLDAITADMPSIQTSDGASPLLTTCAELVSSVRAMEEMCSEAVLAEVAAIAARISKECKGSRRTLQAELQAVSADLRAARLELEPWAALYQRRCAAEALLGTLEALQAEVRGARKEERTASRRLEDLTEETAPGDPALERARATLQQAQARAASLSLRRDGVVAEVVALSSKQEAAGGVELEAGTCGGGVEGEAAAAELAFPELPLRAQRVVLPFQSYALLDAAARARFDVEVLLRRVGLLACDRKYASYADLAVIVASKPNVKRGTLRGAALEASGKILKEYGVAEFKRIKRAVTAARRLRHPGIVPVECAFLELGGSVVVVQAPLYAGGNMREWARGKAKEARLRAAQRVAEAVRFLHAQDPPILHRDLKPENVVFPAASPDAAPALCDFDLSIHAPDATASSTLMLGTLLYLAPEPAPSAASDVFSLGMTLLDVVFCDADEEALRRMLRGSAHPAADAAVLGRVREELRSNTAEADLAALVRRMLAPEPGERPEAREVAEALGELVAVRTCSICHCPEPLDGGVECEAAGRHFSCDACFSLHVTRLEALSAEGRCSVRCFAGGCGAMFSLQDAAAHASRLAFETLCRHVDDAKQVAMEGEFEEWKARYEAEFAAKSEEQRETLAARKQIEEMMDLRCPRCRRVFGEFTGCAALACAYAGCKAHFCAFCLADCGADAHAHVRTCRLNPRQNELFVSKAVWASVVDGQRREKLQARWAELQPGVQDALAADASISQILRDLRLDRLLGTAAFADEVAQLRGMGFTDEGAMRRALAEAQGDVAAALDLL